MLRETVARKVESRERGFRWRSHEISRIEGLSDAVFALAVTLLLAQTPGARQTPDPAASAEQKEKALRAKRIAQAAIFERLMGAAQRLTLAVDIGKKVNGLHSSS